jgi:hypothetical protein
LALRGFSNIGVEDDCGMLRKGIVKASDVHFSGRFVGGRFGRGRGECVWGG